MERPHFLQRPRRHHRIEAPIDSGVELRALRREEEATAVRLIQQGFCAHVMEGGERVTGRLENFQHAQNALRICWPEAGGGEGSRAWSSSCGQSSECSDGMVACWVDGEELVIMEETILAVFGCGMA